LLPYNAVNSESAAKKYRNRRKFSASERQDDDTDRREDDCRRLGFAQPFSEYDHTGQGK